jgi:flagellar hook-length control protein FliK
VTTDGTARFLLSPEVLAQSHTATSTSLAGSVSNPPAANISTTNISAGGSSNPSVASFQNNLLLSGTTNGTASTNGTPSTSSPAPTLATQIADGVISHMSTTTQGGSTEFRMRLDPADLGPVNVHLVSDGDVVRGNVVVASEGVRQMIEGQLPELRQRLEAAGVNVQNFSVTADASGGNNRNPRQEAPSSPTNPLPGTGATSINASTTATNRFRTQAASSNGRLDVVV